MVQDSTGEEFVDRGIKCDLPIKYKQSSSYEVEQEMQQKKRIPTYYLKRNGVSVASLGDKPYKSTNYAPEFYKTPGLIPGSTSWNTKRNYAKKKQIDFTIDKNAKWPMKPRQIWSDRMKREEDHENKKQVLDADVWEETTLKALKAKKAPPEKETKAAAGKQAQPGAAVKKK